MAKERELVAYRAWQCKFCSEVRQDSTDMWRHLMDKHGIRSVENNATHMYRLIGGKEESSG